MAPLSTRALWFSVAGHQHPQSFSAWQPAASLRLPLTADPRSGNKPADNLTTFHIRTIICQKTYKQLPFCTEEQILLQEKYFERRAPFLKAKFIFK
jgi:hypothetical protein